MAITENIKLQVLVCVVLAALALISYGGVLKNDFIGFDDPLYVSENPRIQKGLSNENVIWAFTTTHAGNWHPLAWLSLMLDGRLFKMNPAGYHWTSVILHLLAGLILFLALDRMTLSTWPSAMVATLFLIHPLHVESVAWVAERKDVLSGLFWMIGLWCYARYAQRPNPVRYFWVFLSFTACLLSKPMGVTFPFVLLLLDWWPLHRTKNEAMRWSRLVWEKIPLILFSAVSSVITFFVQKDYHALSSLSAVSLADRLANAAVSYMAYLWKTVWPTGLSIFYPYLGPPPFEYLIAALALLTMITVISIHFHQRRPYLIIGWLWYLGTLVPVIGLVKVGSLAMADRYTYLPLIGIFIIAVWGMKDLFEGYRRGRWVRGVVSGVVIAVLVVLTHAQVGYWKNSTTLFSHALQHTERNFLAHELLAHDRVRVGDQAGAEHHFREALRIIPNFKNACNGLGYLKMIQGKQDEASLLLEKTLRIDPKFAPAVKNLGDVRLRQRRFDDAVALYREAIILYDDYQDPELLNNYGIALFMRGEKQQAILKFREAVSLKPDYAEAKDNLRKVLEVKKGVE